MSKENQRLNGVDQKPAFLDRLSIRARTFKDTFLNLKGFKDVDSKDIKIDGIDPKSYGSFDRTMNYVTGFFNKRRVAFAALLTLTSCTTGGVIGVSVLTSEPRETSTQPGDLTKTSESPTEATYAITSTPGIESTINPPTEEATEMPTLTKTEMPTPTEISEKYPIDLEKFYTMPSSYEDVVANPEKYQEAPDFFGETEVAMKWWEETLIPALGEQKELTPNVFGGAWMDDEYRFDYDAWSREHALLSDYPAFYFKHDNKIYLVPVFTFADDDSMRHAGTFAFILYESQNDGYITGAGLEEIKNIYEGRRILYSTGIKTSEPYTLPDEVKNFVMSEYNWAGVDEYGRIAGTEHFYIGVGAIKTILD